MALIGLNDFAVKNPTPHSGKSYYSGSPEELISLVEKGFDNRKPGYRDGVVLVEVDPKGFFSGIVKVEKGMELHPYFEARRSKEEPYLSIRAVGNKMPASSVQVVLYRKDVLVESNDSCTGAEWDIISINASSVAGGEPMSPVTMARNFMGMEGGTKGVFTAEQFAESIIFWSRHCMGDKTSAGSDQT